MDYFFSASTIGFYPGDMLNDYVAAGSLPGDLVQLTEEQVVTFLRSPYPESKMLGHDGEGHPAWVDVPPLSDQEMQIISSSKRDALVSEATQRINPLQDLVDGFGETDATDAEKQSLIAWKKYRASLSRVTAQAGWPSTVDWPTAPTA